MYKNKVQKIIKFVPSFKTVKPKFGNESRLPLIQGICKVSQAACLTFGPGGRNVVLEYENGDPKITKDGVTVVKSIFNDNRAMEIGMKLVKRVANNTNLFAGDGTTTSTLMSKELVDRGFKAIEFQGAHPISLKRGMDKALKIVLDFLKDISIQVSQPEEIRNVCMVSSNHNEKIADIVSKVITNVGIDGVMNIVESPTGLTNFQLVNGLIFNRGFVSSNFIQEKSGGNIVEQSVEYENPLILVVADKIQNIEDILPVLEIVKKQNQPLVIFSMELQDDPASTMIYNCKKGIIKCIAVNIPWAAGIEKDNLEDIAILTGATMVDNLHFLNIKDVQLHHFGKAQMVKITENQTSIVSGKGSSEDFINRIEQIKVQIQQEEKQQLKNIHKERLARLQAKIAEIQVGGYSEVEKGEERDLIVDALNSAKSAIVGGILPGGGVSMLHASQILKNGLPDILQDHSERIGAQILGQAMCVPIQQLLENKGIVNGAGIIEKIQQQNDIFFGYDIKKEELCDMMDNGIYDSFNVMKVILQDSVSLAGMVVTTECILVKDKSYKPLPLKHYQDRREIF